MPKFIQAAKRLILLNDLRVAFCFDIILLTLIVRKCAKKSLLHNNIILIVC